MAIVYILWSFGVLCGHLMYFSCFGLLYVSDKSGNPEARFNNMVCPQGLSFSLGVNLAPGVKFVP
jgi:hypothetical protein